MEFTHSQEKALAYLDSSQNLFLTGAAGTGKSFLISHFLRNRDKKKYPVLASTGAAAILVGGRTFHSFFGLGILEGGEEKTIQRALSDSRVVRRLEKIDGIIIDEVSMLPGKVLSVAEQIAREARGTDRPWGGLKIIAVGDFLQLPPVSRWNEEKDWAFSNAVWRRSQFLSVTLEEVMRSDDLEFLNVLHHLRGGVITHEVNEFLQMRQRETVRSYSQDWNVTRLYPHRAKVEEYNLHRLGALPGNVREYETEYLGSEKYLNSLKKQAPLPEKLCLKEDSLVMMRTNDPEGRWVNGSLGSVLSLESEKITIQLIDGEIEVEIAPHSFDYLDAEGKAVASARNFPINLAYATTIHKAQGMTLDRLWVDLKGIWEHGQTYVALSRVRKPEGLFLTNWNPQSVVLDHSVLSFYQSFRETASV
jgi:ATP-dependent DNA helicase PIF1